MNRVETGKAAMTGVQREIHGGTKVSNTTDEANQQEEGGAARPRSERWTSHWCWYQSSVDSYSWFAAQHNDTRWYLLDLYFLTPQKRGSTYFVHNISSVVSTAFMSTSLLLVFTASNIASLLVSSISLHFPFQVLSLTARDAVDPESAFKPP